MKPLSRDEVAQFVQALPVGCTGMDIAPLIYSRDAFEEWQAQEAISVCLDIYEKRMGMIQTVGRA